MKINNQQETKFYSMCLCICLEPCKLLLFDFLLSWIYWLFESGKCDFECGGHTYILTKWICLLYRHGVFFSALHCWTTTLYVQKFLGSLIPLGLTSKLFKQSVNLHHVLPCWLFATTSKSKVDGNTRFGISIWIICVPMKLQKHPQLRIDKQVKLIRVLSQTYSFSLVPFQI